MASGSKQSEGGALGENSSDVEVVADPADEGGLPSPDEVGADSSPAPETEPKGAAATTDRVDGDEDGELGDEPSDAGQRVGEMLAGRYELTEFIERGAMGDVYEAEHALMKKQVAVKILNSDISGQGKIVERFRREAQAAANIDHANVCVATDFGETSGGDFFLVMEFREGETLSKVVEREGPLEPGRAMHIAYQITAALARAHEVGVIHRDLKPDNIMLVQRGDDSDFVKILDFGIARVRMEDETPELTKTGAVFGTPSYMSPEQAAGDPIDHRADLYALGNVIFEMATGRRVFEADRGAQVMAMHVSKEPPTPSECIDGTLDPRFEELILQLLDKDPDARPQTAEELQKRLIDLGPDDIGRRVVPDRDESGEQTPVVEELPDDPTQVIPRLLDALSDWFKRKGAATRWAAIGVVGLVSALGLSFLATSDGRARMDAGKKKTEIESAPISLAEQRRRLAERPEVREVLESLNRGAYGRVIAELGELEQQLGDNAHLYYLAGRAHAGREQWAASLSNFEKALEREPRYIRDRQLLDGVIDALGSSNEDVADRAREVIVPRLDYDLVVARLSRAAWKGGSTRLRRRARNLLQSEELYTSLPKWIQYSIELRKSHGCDEHRKNIERLVDLGDPRGLEVLHIYDNFPKRGCGDYDKEDCFGCIRKDIADAIAALEQVKK